MRPMAILPGSPTKSIDYTVFLIVNSSPKITRGGHGEESERGTDKPMREVVIVALAGALIAIIVVALLVHFLP